MALPVPENLEDAALVTHKGCMDGAGCAIMFMLAGGKRENIHYVAAGMVERFVKKDPVFQSNKFLIFADVGLNTPKYAEVLERRGNLVLIDHHDTSLHLLGRHWAEIEEKNQRCGTMMLRDYLIRIDDENKVGFGRRLKSTSYRIFAESIDDHDRWLRQKLPFSEDLATFMVFVGQQDFITRFADPKDRICQNIALGRGKVYFTQFEDDIINILDRRRDEAIEEAMKKVTVKEIKLSDGTQVIGGFVVTNEPNISLLLNRLLEVYPQVQMAVSVCIEKGAVGIRSRAGELDVGRIAGLLGGGGHKGAAGHRLPQDLSEVILEHIYG
jgi:oligoribonuclease NrnB/cAMP/cGMP phosphodiesterase (DHH superfamily)